MELFRLPSIAIAICLASFELYAQPELAQGTQTQALSATNLTKAGSSMLVKEVQPGMFELGDVKINKHERTVSFPAALNMAQGPVEYFLVTSWGKVHESIFRTDTSPYHINIAMLLLGAKPSSTNRPGVDKTPEKYISQPTKQMIIGEPISLEIKWRSEGKETRKDAEELVFNSAANSQMRSGAWTYNGSRIVGQTFVAERDGSVISLITDPDALINNAGPGHDQDTIWAPNTNSLPPSGAIVEVTIKLNRSPR